MRLRLIPLVLVVLAGSLFAAPSLGATTDTLDPAFGTGGLVDESFGFDLAQASAIVEDDAGGFVVAGHVAPMLTSDGDLTIDPGVARFGRDGVLDANFATDGLFTVALSDDVRRQDVLEDVALDPQGRIVAGGDLLLRLLPDGTLDTTFGEAGIVIPRVGGEQVSADSLVVTDTGRIIVAAVAFPDRVLLAYDENGAVDVGFGDAGVATVAGPEGFDVLIGRPNLDLDAQGRIVASGMEPGFDLRRWSADGAVDTEFGDGGVARFVGDLDVRASAITTDGDDVVVAGEAREIDDMEWSPAVARLDADGSLDVSFGDGGVAMGDIDGSSGLHAVALGPDGVIIGVGASGGMMGVDRLAILLTADGEPVLAFGNGGVVLEPLSGPASGQWNDVLVSTDGRAITVGDGYADSGFAFGLAAYHLSGSGEPAPEPRFSDVPADHPFATEIAWMVSEGITTGFPDGTFRPTQTVTRQAAAAFLWRLAGEPEVTSQAGFSDVPADHPFHDEIAWMVSEGITTGFPDGTFRPTQPVTRQAAAAFLYRYDGEPTVTSQAGFSDVPVDHPFHDEIAWMVSEGITTGFPNGTFRPVNNVTRQAMAAFLYRYETDDGDAATGDLYILKLVAGDSAPSSWVFEFSVICDDVPAGFPGDTLETDFSFASDEVEGFYVAWGGFPVGTECTITETDSGDADSVQISVDGEAVGGSSVAVVIEEGSFLDGTHTRVVFTNIFE